MADTVDEGGMVVDRLRLHQKVDLVVEDDDRRDVVLVEPAHGGGRGFARLRNAPASHRAGTIDDECDVDRCALGRWALAAIERDTEIVALLFAGRHHRLREPGAQLDWFVGAGRRV